MTSSRLPGKVLMKINDKSIIQYTYEAVKYSRLVDEVIIATSTDRSDDAIENLCLINKYSFFRGSLNDVMDRYFTIAKNNSAEIIVRITCDCPLVSPDIIDSLINELVAGDYDYASNTCPPEKSSYPDGSDVEVFTFNALNKAFNASNKNVSREHVTFQFWKDASYKSFLLKNNEENLSKYRYTLDYKEDFEVIKFIINELNKKNQSIYSFDNVIDVLKNSDISALNSKYYSGINW